MSDLTAEQLAVVTHPDGRPARVLAGAGTGKTRVIVARFRHLVERGVGPDRILALTFSRAAASQMRSEVVRSLRAASQLWIATFHSFCLRILDLELAEPLRLIQEAEARAILAGLLANPSARAVEEAHAFIGQAKDQLLTPDQVHAYAAASGDQRLMALADLYRRFQEELTRQGAAEFGDFIYRVVQILETNPEARARWQGRFDHILVDEFQDTNLAQFRVLQMLAAPHGNLMVVGDDDQAIYRFRGATDRFIRRFPEYVEGAANYPVVENFRCPQSVLAAANRLIARNAPERVDKLLYTLTKVEGYPPVSYWEARTEREEADAVALEIERRLKQGGRLSEIAILLRSVRRSGGEFARALRDRSIPYRLVGETYPHPVTAQTLALLRLTRSLTAPDLLTVLADRVAPDALFVAVREAKGELVEYLSSGRGPEAVAAAYDDLTKWIDEHKCLPVDQLTYEALRFLGHIRLSLKPSTADIERLAAVRSLQESAAAASSVDAMLEMGTDHTPAAGGGEAVTIMTVHAAKGLQFKTLFVSALAESLFPAEVDAAPLYYLAEAIRDWADTGTLREMTGAERLAQHIREERRLAYVALTRAQEELILTRALTYGGEPVMPSRFLAELGTPEPVTVSGRIGDVVGAARAYLVDAACGNRRAEAASVAAAVSVLKAEPMGLPLRQQVDPTPFNGSDSLSLSASAIEMYRDCPRKYYFRYVLGLEDEDNIHSSFGTAVHAALERFNLARMAGPFPAWDQLASLWDEAIRPEDFDMQSLYRQLRERGRIFLKRYYDWLAVNPGEVISTEGSFAFDYVDSKGRSHRIRGRYDLIERDRAGVETIIDYKTGTRESTGVTKGLRGMSDKHPQRKLQLGLYYLARHGGSVVEGARVSYIFLKHDKDRAPLTWQPALDPGDQVVACVHTAETLQGIRGIIDGVIDGIQANDFTRSPDDWKCSRCPFYDACEVSRRAYF